MCNQEVVFIKHANVGSAERMFDMADILAVKIEPRRASDKGGYLCMPLRQNVPEGRKGWKLVNCPECGRECWERPLPEEFTKDMFSGVLCTMCAMKRGV